MTDIPEVTAKKPKSVSAFRLSEIMKSRLRAVSLYKELDDTAIVVMALDAYLRPIERQMKKESQYAQREKMKGQNN